MDTWSVGQVAADLGVSLPRVRRSVAALRHGGGPGGRVRITPSECDALVRRLGAIPRVEGLSRPQVMVLAALTQAPLGLCSIRAVARASGLSPTAASRSLDRLIELGWVRVDVEIQAHDRAIEGRRWRAEVRDPRWLRAAPSLCAAVLPDPQLLPRPRRVPRRYWHLFWNADPASLDVAGDDAGFVATRMILSDEPSAMAWALGRLDATALLHARSNRGADAATRAMIDNVVQAR